jgi:hypothetical protein
LLDIVRDREVAVDSAIGTVFGVAITVKLCRDFGFNRINLARSRFAISDGGLTRCAYIFNEAGGLLVEQITEFHGRIVIGSDTLESNAMNRIAQT